MYEELEKILRIYANCADYFAKHGDCYGCPMPYKTEPEKGYQRECVGFETKYAALAADAIESLSDKLAEVKADYEAAVDDINKHIHNSTCCKNFKTPERRPGGGCVNSTGSGCSYCTNWTYRGRNKGNG